jgi:hypothetical protein
MGNIYTICLIWDEGSRKLEIDGDNIDQERVLFSQH